MKIYWVAGYGFHAATCCGNGVAGLKQYDGDQGAGDVAVRE